MSYEEVDENIFMLKKNKLALSGSGTFVKMWQKNPEY